MLIRVSRPNEENLILKPGLLDYTFTPFTLEFKTEDIIKPEDVFDGKG